MLASMCLALALYHEARGEPVSGQMMVAKVIVNRIQSNRFPNKMCDVVMQPQTVFIREKRKDIKNQNTKTNGSSHKNWPPKL